MLFLEMSVLWNENFLESKRVDHLSLNVPNYEICYLVVLSLVLGVVIF